MSKPRFAQKRDANHSTIVEHLQRHGCEVRDCSREGTIPDLLVRFKTECPAFIEIKVPGSKAKWTRDQLSFIGNTRFDVAIAKDEQEALYAIKERQFLTREQKDRLAGFLIKSEKAFFTPNEIEKVLQ